MIHRTLQRTENYKFRILIPQQIHFSGYYFIYFQYSLFLLLSQLIPISAMTYDRN
jgi:hypothetical protein